MAKFILANDTLYDGTPLQAAKEIDDVYFDVARLRASGGILVSIPNAVVEARAAEIRKLRIRGQSGLQLDVLTSASAENVPSITIPSGTGFSHVTAGVVDGAAKLVDTADITALAVTDAKIATGVTGSKVDFSGALVPFSAGISVGGTPALSGDVRLNQTFNVQFRDGANDRLVVSGASGALTMGQDANVSTTIKGSTMIVQSSTSNQLVLGANSQSNLYSTVDIKFGNSAGNGKGAFFFSPLATGAAAMNFGGEVTSATIGLVAAVTPIALAINGQAATGTNAGGNLNLSSGASTGLRGGVRLGVNATASSAALLACEDIGTAGSPGRRVVQLCKVGSPASADMPTGDGVVQVCNAQTLPSSNPVGGPLLFGDAGALKARGTGGTTATLCAADPHCPTCAADFALEWSNDVVDQHLTVCVPCMVNAMRKLGADMGFVLKMEGTF